MFCATVSAQPTGAPPRDPLMSLMISQPKLEIPAVTKATSTFDPPVVRPGEPSFLRVTFNALEESVAWPEKIAAPPALDLHPGAHGQMLQMTGTNFEPRTAFNIKVRASGPGSFTVPEFVVKVDGKPHSARGAARSRLRAGCHGAARAAAHAGTSRHQSVRRPGSVGSLALAGGRRGRRCRAWASRS